MNARHRKLFRASPPREEDQDLSGLQARVQSSFKALTRHPLVRARVRKHPRDQRRASS